MVVCVCLAKAEGDEENASVAELPSFTTKLWTSNMNKVIPLFCTAHPLLRITLPHPRWRRFFSVARKEQTRAAFAELKLLFAIIMSQIGRQVCYQKTRKWKKCAWSRSLQWFFTSRPSSCGIIKKYWLRLWIMGAVKAVGQLYGSPTALTRQYLAWDHYCTYVVQTPRVESPIFLEERRYTVSPEPREGDQ